ncbi:MAG: hypothetical protein ACKOUS_14655, partial [Alphaproteobacteria bacterium]
MLARFPSNARVRAALTDLEARIAIGGTSPDALASLARLQAQGRHLEMLALGEELVAPGERGDGAEVVLQVSACLR